MEPIKLTRAPSAPGFPEGSLPGGSVLGGAAEEFLYAPKVEWRRVDLTELTLQLQQLLDLGPGENHAALSKVGSIVSRLKKVLPASHFRDERLRDLDTDFSLWFSKGPRLQFDYNDEALRSMLLVDIHRIKTSL